MKRKASTAKASSCKRGRPRGRPPSDPSEIGPNCNCGGVSGNILCKRAVYCSFCNKCELGCRRDTSCKIPVPICNNTIEDKELRTKKNIDYSELKSPIDDNKEKVYHRNLSLKSTTVTDLATAYGRRTFFIPSAKKTKDSLNLCILSRTEDTDDDISDHVKKCFYPLRIIMNNALNILTGGGEEKNELKALYLEQEFEGWNVQQLVGNAKKIISKTTKSSEIYRTIMALLVPTFGADLSKKYLSLSPRNVKIAMTDFRSLEVYGTFIEKKLKPRSTLVVSASKHMDGLNRNIYNRTLA